ncbi:unnamed protein product [Ixodes pacificus]
MRVVPFCSPRYARTQTVIYTSPRTIRSTYHSELNQTLRRPSVGRTGRRARRSARGNIDLTAPRIKTLSERRQGRRKQVRVLIQISLDSNRNAHCPNKTNRLPSFLA